MALGVIYDDPAPTFESAVVAQNAQASTGKTPNLQKLLSQGQTLAGREAAAHDVAPWASARREAGMTFVVTDACIRCKFMDCVQVCPVEAFREGANILVDRPERVHRLQSLPARVPGRRNPARYRERRSGVDRAEQDLCGALARVTRQGRPDA